MFTAPSMLSLRQRHIDPQLAMGSQRLVESSHVPGGQQGESSSYPSWSRSNLHHNRSQSFGQFEVMGLTPISSAVSHPSIFYASSSSSPPCSSSSSSVPHSSFFHSPYFQPMDPIPDLPDATPQQPRRSGSYGYPSVRSYVLLAWHESGTAVQYKHIFILLSPWILSSTLECLPCWLPCLLTPSLYLKNRLCNTKRHYFMSFCHSSKPVHYLFHSTFTLWLLLACIRVHTPLFIPYLLN